MQEEFPRLSREGQPRETGAGVKQSGGMKEVCLSALSLLIKWISVTLKLERLSSARQFSEQNSPSLKSAKQFQEEG